LSPFLAKEIPLVEIEFGSKGFLKANLARERNLGTPVHGSSIRLPNKLSSFTH
jgi:hypothetical protein